MSSADLAEKVSKSVFQIVCYSNELPKAVASAPPPPPPAVEQQTPSPTYRDTSSSRLNSLAAEYVKLLISSNSDGRTALSVANDAYANYVDYFGKPQHTAKFWLTRSDTTTVGRYGLAKFETTPLKCSARIINAPLPVSMTGL